MYRLRAERTAPGRPKSSILGRHIIWSNRAWRRAADLGHDGGAAICGDKSFFAGTLFSTLRSPRTPRDVRRLGEGSAPSLHSCFSAAGLFRRQTSHFSGSESTPVTLPDAATIGFPGTSEKFGMRFSHSSRKRMISLRASAAPGQRCGPLPNVW